MKSLYKFSLGAALVLLLFSSCKEDDSIENVISLLAPKTNETVLPCCAKIDWQLTEFSPVEIELYSNSDYSSGLIHKASSSALSYSFPISLLPQKTYYLRITAPNATELRTAIKTTNYLDLFEGTHEVEINRRTLMSGFSDTTFYSQLNFTVLDSELVKMEEPETGLSIELPFDELNDSTAIWYVSENPDGNVRLGIQDTSFISRWYPNGFTLGPYWEYSE